MKRWMGMVLALCLLTGCGAETQGTEAEEPPVQAEEPEGPAEESAGERRELDFAYDESGLADWQQTYVDFLRELCRREAAVRDIDRPDYDPNEYPYEIGMLSSGYCLYDINKDGVPELTVRYGDSEAAYHTTVYGWADGAVAELGDFSSGHASLYTWPGENAVAFNWGHMGGHYVQKGSLADGALEWETVFEEGIEEPVEAYTEMADIVPDSQNLREVRTTLDLTFGEEFDSSADQPLLLPIYDYGRERERRELDPDRDAAAQAAIQAVLEDGTEFYGVSADGFGGDTGWTVLERYLAPGGVDRYADTPQKIEKLAWADLNGDGQRECVLRLLDGAEGWPDQYIVFSEQNGTVYAYCLNYCDGYELGTGGVFHVGGWGDTFAVSFWKNQCYQYNVSYDEAVPLVEWEAPPAGV
ncbi:hypothetical protein [uncultured Dysosmobacter sp.]|uniref:hypothetical protein n=1 Tax=uncultured Dysosmobacter sp. TaxID=2591384 RepID=UPI00262228D9|nr:hypothetical protein [uncultured Dysosmobacter sp.]